jgi:hypothetical protein
MQGEIRIPGFRTNQSEGNSFQERNLTAIGVHGLAVGKWPTSVASVHINHFIGEQQRLGV